MEIPDVCVNNWWIVISLLSIGAWLKYKPILSDVLILPCSTSFNIADAVNCFVTEPILKTVDGELGILFFLSAHPYPLDNIIFPFLETKTTPEKPFVALDSR